MSKRQGRARPMRRRLVRLRESAAFSVARLARDLSEGYAVELDDSTSQVLLRAWDDERYEPPIRISFRDEELRRHLRAMADDAQDVFPQATPVQAAYQLFLVHLDEEIATSATNGSVVTLTARGLDVDPVREPERWPEREPTCEFLSPEQYRARYGGEPDLGWVAEPGQ